MATYYDRAAWGAEAPKQELSPWGGGLPTSWTIHYKGDNVPQDLGDYVAWVKNIQHYHMHVSAENYWDIAYNFLVDPIGNSYEGRGWSFRSGAQASGNSSSIAICYLGGPHNPLTNAAKVAINSIIAQRPASWPVYPHSKWIATGCPGAYIRAWVETGRPAGVVPVVVPVVPVVPSPPQVASGTLSVGSWGEDVRNIQKLVGVTPDGIFGPVTKAAVQVFQRKYGLVADGIVGPLTRAVIWRLIVGGRKPAAPAFNLLRAQVTALPVLKRGADGQHVRTLQSALNRTTGARLVVDGKFGPATEGAVRGFQQSQRIQADGIVGPQTRGHLARALDG